MDLSKLINQIAQMKGVKGYILVDNGGNVLVQKVEDAETISKMVFSCGRDMLSMGRKYVRYALFEKADKQNIFIFPVGKYYLGVLKQKNIENLDLARGVLKFVSIHARQGNREEP